MELAILSDEISLDLEESMREGHALGLRKYEIRCLDDFEHRVPDFLPGRTERLEELVADGSIEVTALTPGTFKILPGERDTLRRQLDDVLPRTCALARRLGAPRVIVFGFLTADAAGRAEALKRLREAAAIVAEHGLEMSVENEPGSYCDTGVKTAQMISEIALEHVGINWDPANAVVAGEAAYPIGYEAVRPFLQNVHLKDAIPLPGGKWENRLLGDGGMNWVGQLDALLRDRPVPHLTLETHVFPVLEATREDLRRLKVLFAAARQLPRPAQ
ncbi:MAG: sugar phosphate isomerase/epimerase family protein [Opitutales bacterium]